ncbi:MAG TPA: hypothetical protein ENJ36_00010 [Candidatus Bathyarchaeota archaeon]|nr:hypothetical protein [Candidatus Bathyarchaeota archaeon]
MHKDKLQTLVEQIVDEVLVEDRADISKDYVQSIKRKYPDLYNHLTAQAEFVIQSVRNGYQPTDKVVSLNRHLNAQDDLDPRDSGDTHGVRLFIDYLVKQADQDDERAKEFSGKAKRWYQSTLDALLKKVFEAKTPRMRTLREGVVHKPFTMDLPSDLLQLADIFTMNGYQLVVVGGAVRDALMGKTPKDYDVATDAKPEEVLKMMAQHSHLKTTQVGKAFGVINVYTPEGSEYEVATFRTDAYLKDDYESFTGFVQGKQPKNWEERLRLLASVPKG